MSARTLSEWPPDMTAINPHPAPSCSVIAAVQSHSGSPSEMKDLSLKPLTALVGDGTQLTVPSGNFSLPKRACLAFPGTPICDVVLGLSSCWPSPRRIPQSALHAPLTSPVQTPVECGTLGWTNGHRWIQGLMESRAKHVLLSRMQLFV